jgi:hypothetical protein
MDGNGLQPTQDLTTAKMVHGMAIRICFFFQNSPPLMNAFKITWNHNMNPKKGYRISHTLLYPGKT